MSLADPNPEYWAEYSNLQRVKHEVIRNYLNGWFPKLALGSTGCRRLLYIDTHAGRGKHLEGQLGSPLVAVKTLLEHRSQKDILKHTKVSFCLIERDEQNTAALKRELQTLMPLPKNVEIEAATDNYLEAIGKSLKNLADSGKGMAPSFVFVDPYGFKLPADLLRQLLSFEKVELFVNVIWRELDMAISHANGIRKPAVEAKPSKSLFDFEDDCDDEEQRQAQRISKTPADVRATWESTLNLIFGGDSWRAIQGSTADERADECADLLREALGAKWGTHLRMLDNGRTRYFLLHLTNHDSGRNLMKDCIWKSCPEGGFAVSKSDNPHQRTLIQIEPDLRPLKDWVVDQLKAGPQSWNTLTIRLLPEWWRETHLNAVLRELGKQKRIESSDGKFVAKDNPMLWLKS